MAGVKQVGNDGPSTLQALADLARLVGVVGVMADKNAEAILAELDLTTAQVLEVIGATLLGDAVSKGRSPFGGRLGDAVASPLLTLLDDPTDADAFTATPLDGDKPGSVQVVVQAEPFERIGIRKAPGVYVHERALWSGILVNKRVSRTAH